MTGRSGRPAAALTTWAPAQPHHCGIARSISTRSGGSRRASAAALSGSGACWTSKPAAGLFRAQLRVGLKQSLTRTPGRPVRCPPDTGAAAAAAGVAQGLGEQPHGGRIGVVPRYRLPTRGVWTTGSSRIKATRSIHQVPIKNPADICGRTSGEAQGLNRLAAEVDSTPISPSRSSRWPGSQAIRAPAAMSRSAWSCRARK